MKQVHSPRPAGRLLPAVLVAVLLLAACGEPARPTLPLELADGTACSLDGMILGDFPGPKAQIHYDRGDPDFFCDTREMFSILLRPEQQKRIVAIYTQDMAKADWEQPEGHWLDARSAFFVVGSPRRASMGPTVPGFASAADAASYATQHGGKVLPFAEVTLDMVDLSGGVSHDERM
ncbi:MAG: nitrous oxide reductase accessory protein NosL [Betaproteobacteria bacterium HGW-Betaproteobacteria-7]|jgi:copper chaperone NosL|nr:MAG: nitrous oxide reductase accessory protein NosL [Betaproteobacteria bacterium HGW-Betaproteobacteria-7]